MKKLIAIVGMSGTGKSIATDYLENKGWCKLYFGGITYKLMKEQGIERTEDGKSEKEFREKKRRNEFGETAEYRGWWYGSAIKDYAVNAVIILTPSGFRKVDRLMLPTIPIMSVYVRVPRRERLIRILKRGDDIEEAYRRSLSDVGMFDGIADEVDFVIDNSEKYMTPYLAAQSINLEYAG